MICMGSDKAKAAQLLDQLNAAGVRNVLTLRGDRTPPARKPGLCPRKRPGPVCVADPAGI